MKPALTYEQAHEFFEYRDGDLYWKINPKYHNKIGKKVGTLNEEGYVTCGLFHKSHYVHRIIYLMHHGKTPAQVDHIDNNKSNNKIENLRAASQQQNSCNEKLRSTNTSGVKGVSFNKRLQKWHARIGHFYKEIHVGYFTTLEEAEKAVKEKREQLNMEFTNHG
jgi:hypothetical protein